MKALSLTAAIAFILTLGSATAHAQGKNSSPDFQKEITILQVSGVMTINDQRVSDYTVYKYEDGVLVDSFYIDNRREQYFGCELGHNYSLRFVKPGFKERVMLIDAHLPEEASSENYTFRYSIEFIAKDAASNTFDDFPVAYITYDKKKQDFDYNKTYHYNVRNNARQAADQTVSK